MKKPFDITGHNKALRAAGKNANRAISDAVAFYRKTRIPRVYLYHADYVAIEKALNGSGYDTSGGLAIYDAMLLDSGD